MRRRRPAFTPGQLVAGFGAAWAINYEHPVVVRIELGRLEGQIRAAFPADDGQGPGALAVGLGSVWALPGGGSCLIQIDPASGATQPHELPFPLASICAGAGAVFGIGAPGDGRVARFSPADGVTVAESGRTLRLVAADGDFAWVADDAAAMVLVLDAQSLQPVAEFPDAGSPDWLFASGSQAWYVATTELEVPPEGGRPQRAARVDPDGHTVDLLRLDARTGSTQRLRQLHGGRSQAALGGGQLWIAQERRDESDLDDDPVSLLRCLDLDGREVSVLERVGQVRALAADDSTVWVSEFHQLRETDVTTALGHDGTVLGQVSFAPVDLRPWTQSPHRRLWLSRAARAEVIRDEVERDLSEAQQTYDRFGDSQDEPPVSQEFRLERVELLGTGKEPEIAVLFRWAGQDDLFGLKYRVPRRGDTYISVHVQENLLGDGIENAVREPADGVTWLRWPG